MGEGGGRNQLLRPEIDANLKEPTQFIPNIACGIKCGRNLYQTVRYADRLAVTTYVETT